LGDLVHREVVGLDANMPEAVLADDMDDGMSFTSVAAAMIC
jgi:hypothetical protein